MKGWRERARVEAEVGLPWRKDGMRSLECHAFMVVSVCEREKWLVTMMKPNR